MGNCEYEPGGDSKDHRLVNVIFITGDIELIITVFARYY